MSITSIFSKLISRGETGPAPPHPLEELALAWQQRCARFPLVPGPRSGRSRRAVLVTPWLGSAVSFFGLEVMRLLANEGENVCVIYDACDVIGNAPSPREVALLDEAVAALPREIEVIQVNDKDRVEEEADDEKLARQIIYEIGVWRTRGESEVSRFVHRKEVCVPRLRQHLARVRALLSRESIDWLLLPGGVWGLSLIYTRAARRVGANYMTHDAGNRFLCICQNDCATHQNDLSKAFKMFEPELAAAPQNRARIIEWSRRELSERREGRGNYATFQKVGTTGCAVGDANILVPLNLRWDSAALNRARLFADVREWIRAIVTWAATEPLARICIRQHPIERFEEWRSSDDLAAFVREINTSGDRVQFIGASDPVNTYDLLRDVRVLLPFTSSMGMEAPMLGIPVITSAHTYYDGFDFVHRPESTADYFELISRALRGELHVHPAAQECAAIVYFLAQHCNILPTAFTAAPQDFLEWVTVPPAELAARPEIQDLKRALLTGEPLAFIRAQRFLAEAKER